MAQTALGAEVGPDGLALPSGALLQRPEERDAALEWIRSAKAQSSSRSGMPPRADGDDEKPHNPHCLQYYSAGDESLPVYALVLGKGVWEWHTHATALHLGSKETLYQNDNNNNNNPNNNNEKEEEERDEESGRGSEEQRFPGLLPEWHGVIQLVPTTVSWKAGSQEEGNHYDPSLRKRTSIPLPLSCAVLPHHIEPGYLYLTAEPFKPPQSRHDGGAEYHNPQRGFNEPKAKGPGCGDYGWSWPKGVAALELGVLDLRLRPPYLQRVNPNGGVVGLTVIERARSIRDDTEPSTLVEVEMREKKPLTEVSMWVGQMNRWGRLHSRHDLSRSDDPIGGLHAAPLRLQLQWWPSVLSDERFLRPPSAMTLHQPHDSSLVMPEVQLYFTCVEHDHLRGEQSSSSGKASHQPCGTDTMHDVRVLAVTTLSNGFLSLPKQYGTIWLPIFSFHPPESSASWSPGVHLHSPPPAPVGFVKLSYRHNFVRHVSIERPLYCDDELYAVKTSNSKLGNPNDTRVCESKKDHDTVGAEALPLPLWPHASSVKNKGGKKRGILVGVLAVHVETVYLRDVRHCSFYNRFAGLPLSTCSALKGGQEEECNDGLRGSEDSVYTTVAPGLPSTFREEANDHDEERDPRSNAISPTTPSTTTRRASAEVLLTIGWQGETRLLSLPLSSSSTFPTQQEEDPITNTLLASHTVFLPAYVETSEEERSTTDKSKNPFLEQEMRVQCFTESGGLACGARGGAFTVLPVPEVESRLNITGESAKVSPPIDHAPSCGFTPKGIDVLFAEAMGEDGFDKCAGTTERSPLATWEYVGTPLWSMRGDAAIVSGALTLHCLWIPAKPSSERGSRSMHVCSPARPPRHGALLLPEGILSKLQEMQASVVCRQQAQQQPQDQEGEEELISYMKNQVAVTVLSRLVYPLPYLPLRELVLPSTFTAAGTLGKKEEEEEEEEGEKTPLNAHGTLHEHDIRESVELMEKENLTWWRLLAALWKHTMESRFVSPDGKVVERTWESDNSLSKADPRPSSTRRRPPLLPPSSPPAYVLFSHIEWVADFSVSEAAHFLLSGATPSSTRGDSAIAVVVRCWPVRQFMEDELESLESTSSSVSYLSVSDDRVMVDQTTWTSLHCRPILLSSRPRHSTARLGKRARLQEDGVRCSVRWGGELHRPTKDVTRGSHDNTLCFPLLRRSVPILASHLRQCESESSGPSAGVTEENVVSDCRQCSEAHQRSNPTEDAKLFVHPADISTFSCVSSVGTVRGDKNEEDKEKEKKHQRRTEKTVYRLEVALYLNNEVGRHHADGDVSLAVNPPLPCPCIARGCSEFVWPPPRTTTAATAAAPATKRPNEQEHNMEALPLAERVSIPLYAVPVSATPGPTTRRNLSTPGLEEMEGEEDIPMGTSSVRDLLRRMQIKRESAAASAAAAADANQQRAGTPMGHVSMLRRFWIPERDRSCDTQALSCSVFDALRRMCPSSEPRSPPNPTMRPDPVLGTISLREYAQACREEVRRGQRKEMSALEVVPADIFGRQVSSTWRCSAVAKPKHQTQMRSVCHLPGRGVPHPCLRGRRDCAVDLNADDLSNEDREEEEDLRIFMEEEEEEDLTKEEEDQSALLAESYLLEVVVHHVDLLPSQQLHEAIMLMMGQPLPYSEVRSFAYQSGLQLSVQGEKHLNGGETILTPIDPASAMETRSGCQRTGEESAIMKRRVAKPTTAPVAPEEIVKETKETKEEARVEGCASYSTFLTQADEEEIDEAARDIQGSGEQGEPSLLDNLHLLTGPPLRGCDNFDVPEERAYNDFHSQMPSDSLGSSLSSLSSLRGGDARPYQEKTKEDNYITSNSDSDKDKDNGVTAASGLWRWVGTQIVAEGGALLLHIRSLHNDGVASSSSLSVKDSDSTLFLPPLSSFHGVCSVSLPHNHAVAAQSPELCFRPALSTVVIRDVATDVVLGHAMMTTRLLSSSQHSLAPQQVFLHPVCTMTLHNVTGIVHGDIKKLSTMFSSYHTGRREMEVLEAKIKDSQESFEEKMDSLTAQEGVVINNLRQARFDVEEMDCFSEEDGTPVRAEEALKYKTKSSIREHVRELKAQLKNIRSSKKEEEKTFRIHMRTQEKLVNALSDQVQSCGRNLLLTLQQLALQKPPMLQFSSWIQEEKAETFLPVSLFTAEDKKEMNEGKGMSNKMEESPYPSSQDKPSDTKEHSVWHSSPFAADSAVDVWLHHQATAFHQWQQSKNGDDRVENRAAYTPLVLPEEFSAAPCEAVLEIRAAPSMTAPLALDVLSRVGNEELISRLWSGTCGSSRVLHLGACQTKEEGCRGPDQRRRCEPCTLQKCFSSLQFHMQLSVAVTNAEGPVTTRLPVMGESTLFIPCPSWGASRRHTQPHTHWLPLLQCESSASPCSLQPSSTAPTTGLTVKVNREWDWQVGRGTHYISVLRVQPSAGPRRCNGKGGSHSPRVLSDTSLLMSSTRYDENVNGLLASPVADASSSSFFIRNGEDLFFRFYFTFERTGENIHLDVYPPPHLRRRDGWRSSATQKAPRATGWWTLATSVLPRIGSFGAVLRRIAIGEQLLSSSGSEERAFHRCTSGKTPALAPPCRPSTRATYVHRLVGSCEITPELHRRLFVTQHGAARPGHLPPSGRLLYAPFFNDTGDLVCSALLFSAAIPHPTVITARPKVRKWRGPANSETSRRDSSTSVSRVSFTPSRLRRELLFPQGTVAATSPILEGPVSLGNSLGGGQNGDKTPPLPLLLRGLSSPTIRFVIRVFHVKLVVDVKVVEGQVSSSSVDPRPARTASPHPSLPFPHPPLLFLSATVGADADGGGTENAQSARGMQVSNGTRVLASRSTKSHSSIPINGEEGGGGGAEHGVESCVHHLEAHWKRSVPAAGDGRDVDEASPPSLWVITSPVEGIDAIEHSAKRRMRILVFSPPESLALPSPVSVTPLPAAVPAAAPQPEEMPASLATMRNKITDDTEVKGVVVPSAEEEYGDDEFESEAGEEGMSPGSDEQAKGQMTNSETSGGSDVMPTRSSSSSSPSPSSSKSTSVSRQSVVSRSSSTESARSRHSSLGDKSSASTPISTTVESSRSSASRQRARTTSPEVVVGETDAVEGQQGEGSVNFYKDGRDEGGNTVSLEAEQVSPALDSGCASENIAAPASVPLPANASAENTRSSVRNAETLCFNNHVTVPGTTGYTAPSYPKSDEMNVFVWSGPLSEWLDTARPVVSSGVSTHLPTSSRVVQSCLPVHLERMTTSLSSTPSEAAAAGAGIATPSVSGHLIVRWSLCIADSSIVALEDEDGDGDEEDVNAEEEETEVEHYIWNSSEANYRAAAAVIPTSAGDHLALPSQACLRPKSAISLDSIRVPNSALRDPECCLTTNVVSSGKLMLTPYLTVAQQHQLSTIMGLYPSHLNADWADLVEHWSWKPRLLRDRLQKAAHILQERQYNARRHANIEHQNAMEEYLFEIIAIEVDTLEVYRNRAPEKRCEGLPESMREGRAANRCHTTSGGGATTILLQLSLAASPSTTGGLVHGANTTGEKHHGSHPHTMLGVGRCTVYPVIREMVEWTAVEVSDGIPSTTPPLFAGELEGLHWPIDISSVRRSKDRRQAQLSVWQLLTDDQEGKRKIGGGVRSSGPDNIDTTNHYEDQKTHKTALLGTVPLHALADDVAALYRHTRESRRCSPFHCAERKAKLTITPATNPSFSIPYKTSWLKVDPPKSVHNSGLCQTSARVRLHLRPCRSAGSQAGETHVPAGGCRRNPPSPNGGCRETISDAPTQGTALDTLSDVTHHVHTWATCDLDTHTARIPLPFPALRVLKPALPWQSNKNKQWRLLPHTFEPMGCLLRQHIVHPVKPWKRSENDTVDGTGYAFRVLHSHSHSHSTAEFEYYSGGVLIPAAFSGFLGRKHPGLWLCGGVKFSVVCGTHKEEEEKEDIDLEKRCCSTCYCPQKALRVNNVLSVKVQGSLSTLLAPCQGMTGFFTSPLHRSALMSSSFPAPYRLLEQEVESWNGMGYERGHVFVEDHCSPDGLISLDYSAPPPSSSDAFLPAWRSLSAIPLALSGRLGHAVVSKTVFAGGDHKDDKEHFTTYVVIGGYSGTDGHPARGVVWNSSLAQEENDNDAYAPGAIHTYISLTEASPSLMTSTEVGLLYHTAVCVANDVWIIGGWEVPFPKATRSVCRSEEEGGDPPSPSRVLTPERRGDPCQLETLRHIYGTLGPHSAVHVSDERSGWASPVFPVSWSTTARRMLLGNTAVSSPPLVRGVVYAVPAAPISLAAKEETPQCVSGGHPETPWEAHSADTSEEERRRSSQHRRFPLPYFTALSSTPLIACHSTVAVGPLLFTFGGLVASPASSSVEVSNSLYCLDTSNSTWYRYEGPQLSDVAFPQTATEWLWPGARYGHRMVPVPGVRNQFIMVGGATAARSYRIPSVDGEPSGVQHDTVSFPTLIAREDMLWVLELPPLDDLLPSAIATVGLCYVEVSDRNNADIPLPRWRRLEVAPSVPLTPRFLPDVHMDDVGLHTAAPFFITIFGGLNFYDDAAVEQSRVPDAMRGTSVDGVEGRQEGIVFPCGLVDAFGFFVARWKVGIVPVEDHKEGRNVVRMPPQAVFFAAEYC